MFERYTEKARRTIFFARYEASQFASGQIEAEHLLLGLLRENKTLFQYLSHGTKYESIEKELFPQAQVKPPIPTSVDLRLSEESKRVLKHAADEADGLKHRHIGTEHLLLGLLRENKSLAAKVLIKYGAELASIRKKIEQSPEEGATVPYAERASRIRAATADTIEIHGSRFNPEYIHDAVKRCRQYNWHWHKEPWAARDIVMDRSHGTVSFDLRLAEDAANFELVKAGWKQDHCVICRWLFFESKDDPSHTEGYTNGREWLCTECYEKFWSRPDFFSSPYSDIT